MAVVGRAFLLAMGRANGAVHVEHDDLQPVPCMHSVDPDSRKSGERGEVVVDCQQLSLEPAHLAGRCAAALDSLAADDPPHRGIAPEPVASFTSSDPASRPKTDWRSRPTTPCQPFLPVLLSAIKPRRHHSPVRLGPGHRRVRGRRAGRVGCDPRTVELQLQPSVETGPKWARSDSPSGYADLPKASREEMAGTPRRASASNSGFNQDQQMRAYAASLASNVHVWRACTRFVVCGPADNLGADIARGRALLARCGLAGVGPLNGRMAKALRYLGSDSRSLVVPRLSASRTCALPT